MFNNDDDRDFELNARYDYIREAYGDPCPGCGTLRGGGDCIRCYDEATYEPANAAELLDMAPEPVAELPVDWSNVDDDIVF